MPTPVRLPVAARDAILAWYAERGRPLAFRRTSDPYAILVSEAMAQQTQAARAAAYWERFMERFPTVQVLATSTPADVLRAWAGLGYDRRALALWRAARVIVDEHAGRVPSSVSALQALPGVGPYTARAVAALAFGVPVGAVDVNVRRVLGRIVVGTTDPLGMTGASGAPGRADRPGALSPAAFQDVADAAAPPDQPGTWTHAVMDVGATLCKPRAPRCGECPARPWCRYATGQPHTASGAPVGRRPTLPTTTPTDGRVAHDRPAPFSTTNRWLRGRILDRLRAVPDGVWVTLDAGIGEHGHDRVRVAAAAMAADGVLELHPDTDGPVRARLPLS